MVYKVWSINRTPASWRIASQSLFRTVLQTTGKEVGFDLQGPMVLSAGRQSVATQARGRG